MTATERSRFVLDSFALLAYLEDEHGASLVQDILTKCADEEAVAYLSVVNLGEVAYIVERERGLPAAQQALAAIDQFPLNVLDADRTRTLAAAHIKALYPVSYADSFAIALGMEVDGHVVTGDPELERVEPVVGVVWIGRK